MPFLKSKEDLQRYVLTKLAMPQQKNDNQILTNLKQRLTKTAIKSPFGK